MYSLGFPKMFNDGRTSIIKDHDAIRSNLKLLLMSDKYSLLGDPYYGTELKRVLFENNDVVLADLIIDEIYTAIKVYLPQIGVERKNIEIYADRHNIYAKISCIYKLDNVSDLFIINLTSEGE